MLAVVPDILVKSGWQRNQKQLVERGAWESPEGKDNLLNVKDWGARGKGNPRPL